jgi:hypothetical protein
MPALNAFSALPGGYYIATFDSHRLTAAFGGGQTVDAIRTTVGYPSIGPYETFKLWHNSGQPQPNANSQFAFQTFDNHYVTAVDGGGRTSDVIHTDATQIQAWEEFGLEPVDPSHTILSIRTATGNFMTAVGLGGKVTDAIHTDAVQVQDWEKFKIGHVGDLGSGYRYYIVPDAPGVPMCARNGGNQTQKAFVLSLGVNPQWGSLKLDRTDDGFYTIQVLDGHYVTAVNGGGLSAGTPDADNMQTNRTTALGWEKFQFIYADNGYYHIQTMTGYYLIANVTANSEISTAADLAHAGLFQLFLAI